MKPASLAFVPQLVEAALLGVPLSILPLLPSHVPHGWCSKVGTTFKMADCMHERLGILMVSFLYILQIPIELPGMYQDLFLGSCVQTHEQDKYSPFPQRAYPLVGGTAND